MSAVALLAELLVFGVAGAHSLMPAAAAQTSSENPPSDVLALLPEGAHVQAAVLADLMGSGEPQWAVVFDLPARAERPENMLVGDHLALVAPTLAGWELVRNLGFGSHVAGGARLVEPIRVELRDIGGSQALVLLIPIGAHAARLAIVRWDGDNLNLVYDGETGGGGRPESASAFGVQGLLVDDRDGDGVPEVVARQPSLCVYDWAGPPRFLTVHRWDAGRYVRATSQYPSLLAEAEAEVQMVLDDVAAGRAPVGAPPASQACLHRVVAALALEAGQRDGAMAECQRAEELEPAPPAPGAGVTCDVLLGRWTTHQDAEHGIAFGFPRRWNEERLEQCGVRRHETGLWLGSRIEVAVVAAAGRSLDEWVEEFVAARAAEPYDWRFESVGRRLVGGQQAIRVDYRFGGLNRYGTATMVARGESIYAMGFTAGGFTCDEPSQGLTEGVVYGQMLASLEFLDQSSTDE